MPSPRSARGSSPPVLPPCSAGSCPSATPRRASPPPSSTITWPRARTSKKPLRAPAPRCAPPALRPGTCCVSTPERRPWGRSSLRRRPGAAHGSPSGRRARSFSMPEPRARSAPAAASSAGAAHSSAVSRSCAASRETTTTTKASSSMASAASARAVSPPGSATGCAATPGSSGSAGSTRHGSCRSSEEA